jgi:nicotinamide riboside kinase
LAPAGRRKFGSTIAVKPEPRRRGLCVAVLGAECTGKTSLAQSLQHHFSAPPHSLRVAWVPEFLRQWCQAQGRTPQQHEQLAILQTQTQLIAAAAQQHDLILCDTTGLMTAVYSEVIFGDTSLNAQALAAHTRIDLTLLMAVDLPWQADGHQRDGAHRQQPVDQALRSALAAGAAPFVVIAGAGAARLEAAVAAVSAALHLPVRAPTAAQHLRNRGHT